MSKEIAKKLIAELETNEELKAKIEGIDDPEKLLKMAVEAGYEVSMEDLRDAETELKKERAARTDAKLSIDELEDVAGGKAWDGEDAPDGHELGCLIFYHHSGYSKENEVWCKDNYYCSGTYRTCAYFDRMCARDVY